MASSRTLILLPLFFLSLSPFSTAARVPHYFLSSTLKTSKSSCKHGNKLFEAKYFTQTLDHFNFLPESYTTFQQKYLVNYTYWGGAEEAAPIFLYAGNEGKIEWFAENTGFMFDIAPRFRALLVFIEHRYYGDSIPFGGKEVAYSNASTLGYLSSTQALADFATLMVDLKRNLSAERSPVVVFGGSYGGMLAAWFRLKYPHMVIGALASSAPILEFDGLVSPYAFNDLITRDFREESESCYKTIKGVWKAIDEAYDRPGGFEELEKAFKICKGQVEQRGLADWISSALFNLAMTDYPTPTNFVQPLPAHPVKEACKAVDDLKSGYTTFQRVYAAMNLYYNYTGTQTCFNLTADDPHGSEEWDWQACTEMLQPVEGSSDDSMFAPYTWNMTEWALSCKQNTGVPARVHWITTEYGGYHIKRVLKRFGSNMIFFNGLRDPWSTGGVLESISDTIVAIVSPQGAHHIDLRFATEDDPDWLKEVRTKETRIISKWLQEYYNDLDMTISG